MELINITMYAMIAVNSLNSNKMEQQKSPPQSQIDCLFSTHGCASSDNKYFIHVVTLNDVEKSMDLLRRTFFVDEPLNKAINLCPGGIGCPELEEFCRRDLLSGYSLVATDVDGKIIAIIVSGLAPLREPMDGNDLTSQAEKSQDPKFQKILYILANREKSAKLWEKYPNIEHLLEIKIVATDHAWRRQGIMTKLIEKTEQLAKHKNIHLIRIDTSSLYSAMGAEKRGYTLIYKALYTDIKRYGKPLIVPEKPHVDDRVYVKQLIP